MPMSQTDTEHESNWRRLYRFAYARLGNRQEAEDLAQETYTRSLARSDRPDQAPSLPYLFTVALNLLRDRWRKPKRVEVPFDEGMDGPVDSEDRLARQAWVREAMSRLPEEYRTVLELRLVQGYSREEVARRMGRTEDAVRGLQYRALQTLRQWTKEESE